MHAAAEKRSPEAGNTRTEDIVVAVRGSVVEARFGHDLPCIGSILEGGVERNVVIEVLAQLDPRHVRGIRAQSDTRARAWSAGLRHEASARGTRGAGGALTDVQCVRACNRPGRTPRFSRVTGGASYEPACERVLPLDAQWQQRFTQLAWPTQNLPQAVGPIETTLLAYLREYLFASLFRACAESLCSENASRLAAMQRAERNVGSLVDELTDSMACVRPR
jgi:hypothetical protein